MSTAWFGFLSALWLGILTSISPCPLATNIAAISFVSKKIMNPRSVLLSGLAYTAGRMLAYALVGFLIISAFFSVPVLANFLQTYMNKIFGPILIFTGLFLLEILKFNMPGFSLSEQQQNDLAGSGIKGAFALGFIFALVFCPIAAALFFGSLIPLALNNKIGPVLPFVYGVGTGIPVLIFAVAIALGATSLSRWFHRITGLEYYTRRITGIIFILVGLYYIWAYVL